MADRKTRNAFLELLDEIQRRTSQLDNFTMGNAIKFTLDESKADFLCGEEGIAFQTLTNNLNEVRFPLSAEILDRIAAMGQSIGLPDASWSFLGKLVCSSTKERTQQPEL